MLKQNFKILFTVFIIIFLMTSVCFATDTIGVTSTQDENVVTNSENSITNTETNDVASTESTNNYVEDDLYLFDTDIVINGVVDGNIFAFGTNVTINAEVTGNIFVFADTLTIEKDTVAYCSVISFSKNLILDGIVYDVYSATSDFTLGENGIIYRDLRLFSVNTNINGKIRRNAHITSNNIKFANEEDTFIGGDLNYSSNAELSIPENAILGSVNFNKVEEKDYTPSAGEIIKDAIFDVLTLVLSTLILTLLAIWLTPKFLKKLSNMKISNMFIAIAIGLGALIAIPIASILFMITIIGVPSSLALLTLYILVLSFSTGFASLVIGSFITNKFNITGKVKFVFITLASTIVIYLLGLIPFIGGLFKFVILLLGLGTVVYNLFKKLPETEIE